MKHLKAVEASGMSAEEYSMLQPKNRKCAECGQPAKGMRNGLWLCYPCYDAGKGRIDPL